MCGITGFFGFNEERALTKRVLGQMTDALVHRGPDDQGLWLNNSAGIGLGHRRLSILDLSSQGHQPMESKSGRFVIAFNGEIYNFVQIREEIEKAGALPSWRGTSDTEVILEAISHWGLEVAIQKFVGMFAFALWDQKRETLHLARDRLGEKPLYYGMLGNTLLFGSELKALRKHPKWSDEIDRGGLALLLRYGYIPAPYSIYKNIYKLLPGTILSLTRQHLNGNALSPVPYWALRKKIEEFSSVPFRGSAQDCLKEAESLLKKVVKQQMISDVPLGAFLSGGIDSSAVVALMQTQSSRPVKTFTIGFSDLRYDESQFAKSVAQHLGTNHTELILSSQEALSVIPRLPAIYDEPFADSSQIPTFLVARLARQQVTVCLSGDGGDEVFAGYNRYLWTQKIWNATHRFPMRIRSVIAKLIRRRSPASWDRFFKRLDPFLPTPMRVRIPGDKLYKLAGLLNLREPRAFYHALISYWEDPCSFIPGSTELPTQVIDRNEWKVTPTLTQQMRYLDTVTYIPDDILTKVDRACMGVSLESRIPYLDHRVLEFAWKIPLGMHVGNGKGKQILRSLLSRYLPSHLIGRPKMGFAMPLDKWLRSGPLREWAESLLEERKLKNDGFFDPEPIRKRWREHLSQTRNWQLSLWAVLMFQAWKESQN